MLRSYGIVQDSAAVLPNISPSSWVDEDTLAEEDVDRLDGEKDWYSGFEVKCCDVGRAVEANPRP